MTAETDPREEQKTVAAESATETGARAVLLAYATRHGSTGEIAAAVGEQLKTTLGAGAEVTVKSIDSSLDPRGYDAVVVGAPMIMGWHRDALKFVRRHQDVLAAVPTALFVVAASLTETSTDIVRAVPLFKDPWLVKEPKSREKLRYRERYAAPEHYLGDILEAAPKLRPLEVAFFGGTLDLQKMNLLEKLFVMLVVNATPGDLRNWEAIRKWSADLAPRLVSGTGRPA